MNIRDKFLETSRRYNMLCRGETVTAAVSGGADSMALMRLLCIYKERFGYSLQVCHVNHGLRGDDADRDELLVKNECEKQGVPFFVKRVNVYDICRLTGEGEEECGRRIRYEFFEEVSHGGTVATAHTLSDRAETLLFNIARGTSLKGLCSIPPVRDNIVRPLIACERAETEGFCREQDIDFAVDCTNSDTAFSRNRIRKNVIPELKKINPGFLSACERLFECSASDEEHLGKTALRALEESEISPGAGYSAAKLSAYDRCIVTRACRMAAEKNGAGVSFSQIEDIADAVISGSGGASLTGGVNCRVKNGILSFKKIDCCDKENTESVKYFEIPFCEGTQNTPGGIVKIKKCKKENYLAEKGCAKINNLLLYNLIGCDTIFHNPVIRGRREGDSITLYTRGVTKSLKKLFNEQKIPPEKRPGQIVIADDNGVLWVQSAGPDKKAAVSADTEYFYEITVETGNE